MESLRRSFKSHGSYKHIRRLSIGGGNSNDESKPEELPILMDQEPPHHHQQQRQQGKSGDNNNLRELSVMIDGGDSSANVKDVNKVDHRRSNTSENHMWRESSGNFWEDKEEEEEEGSSIKNPRNDGKEGSFEFVQRGGDPTSHLIGQFLNKQKNTGEIALDMDLEMEELKNNNYTNSNNLNNKNNNNNNNENNNYQHSSPISQSKELRVSFDPSTADGRDESSRRRYRDSPSYSGESVYNSQQQRDQTNYSNNYDYSRNNNDEPSRTAANGSFGRKPSFQRNKSSLLTKTKTKSRLLDPPPEELETRSGRIGKSGPISGFLGKPTGEEEDDPLSGEDLPEEYRKSKFSFLTLIQWLSLIFIIAALICSLAIPELKKQSVWDLHLWKWEVLVLVLICGRLVSGWGIRLIVFFIERSFLLRKRVLYFVYGVRKPVQNCLWLGLGLLAWRCLFDKKVQRETTSVILPYVTKLLVCFLLGTLIWLVKTLMVKVLASSFHVSTYFDRIQESLFNQFVIETLSGPPMIEYQRNEDDMERARVEVDKLENAGAYMPPDLREAAFSGPCNGGSRVIGKSSRLKSVRFSGLISKKNIDTGITIDHLHKLNHKNVSAWNMKRLMNIVRHGALSTLDEQILGDPVDDENANQIRSEYEAKTAARKIFLNVARIGSKYIYLEDLMRFMQEDEAVTTMSLFEGASENQRISKKALKNWVVAAFRERRALALTLNDTKTAVNKLHHIVNVVVAIIILIVFLLVLDLITSKFLLLVTSQLVLVAFVFGNTCKTIFEAVIFLFVIHPFDVGDRCEIDGNQMVVEEMNILTTVFLRYDNLKITYPNSTLSIKPINNFYRSPDMGDAIEFCVHISTPAEKIALMRQRIISFIETKKEHWYPSPTVVLKEVEDLNRLRMAVWMRHRMNHQDIGEKWIRRAYLLEEMVKMFRELDIQYRLYPLDINVRSVPFPTSERMPSTWAAPPTT